MVNHFANWRDSLLERARKSEAALAEVSRKDNYSVIEWEEIQRRHELEYMERFDPAAGLQEEIALRLTGNNAEDGSIPGGWEQLLKYFRNALKEFSPKPLDVRMTRVSAGSTILHFVDGNASPLSQDDTSQSGAFERVHQTPLADAAQELFKLVEATESQLEVKEWADQLESFEKFARELSSNQLEADFRHFGSGGRVRGASLSKEGLEYLETWSVTQDEEKNALVNGRIRELTLSTKDDISGYVRVKAGTHRTAQSTTVEVPLAKKSMLENYRLGQQVSLKVIQVFTVDRIGREEIVKYVFDEDVTSASTRLDF